VKNKFINASIAYLIWGSFPLYWKQLEQVPALQILGHRVVWSFLFLMLLLTLQRGWSGLLQGVRLILANQFISQIREANIMQSLFGNVGILASFRLGIDDAAAVESQFLPYFDRSDLSNLPNWQACVKAKIQGQTPAAFTMNTLLPAVQPSAETAARVRAFSQQTYGRPRAAVEEITSKRVKTLKNHKPESFRPCFCANRDSFYSKTPAGGLTMQTDGISNRS